MSETVDLFLRPSPVVVTFHEEPDVVVALELNPQPVQITIGGSGPAGPQGPTGPQGPQGPAGEDGAQGEQGPPGEDGADGADGAPGAAATVVVGSTTTGTPGTDAAVTNSGTASAAVLEFTIPRGATGAQGPQGDPGVDGDPGVAFNDGANPTTSAVGDAAATGDDTFAARRDHVHGRESFATPAIVLGTSAAAGAATTPIRSDSTIAAFDATSPTTQAFGDSPAVGSAAFAARRDHKHGMPTIALGDLPTTPGCHAYSSSNQSLTSTVATALALNQERYDTDTMHDTVTDNTKVVCKTAGKFHLTGAVAFEANGTGDRQARLLLNGTTIIAIQVQGAVSGVQTVVQVATDYALAVNDYVELVAYQGSGSTLNSEASANYAPFLSAARTGA